MVSPEAIVFAVRALIRMGTATRDAFEQHVRDADIFMPLPAEPELDPITYIRDVFRDEPYKSRVMASGDLAPFWDAAKRQPKDDPESRKRIIDAVELIWQTDLAKPKETWYGGVRRQEQTGYVILRQWAKKDAPPPPIARVVLAMADVAFEYVGTNPSIFGVGSSGAQLVTALAENMRALLPDADDPQDWPPEGWSKYYFAERAVTIFLHAGLKTLTAYPDVFIKEKHFQELVTNVLTPLVDAFDQDPVNAPKLITIRDTLLGPMASAALTTIATQQAAILGSSFDLATPLGAVTNALLSSSADLSQVNVRDVFTERGLVRLYQSTLQVMVDRPELFFGKGTKPEDALKQDFFTQIALILRDAPPPFHAALAAPLGIAAVDALSNYTMHFLDADDSWEATAETVLQSFVAGIKAGIQDGTSEVVLRRVLSPRQLIEFAQIFFQQAARTPRMLTGTSASLELTNVVAAVASAMGAHGSNLLSGEDWLAIAAAAAAEAAKNPERLFKLDTADPADQLAAKLITHILSVSADAFSTAGRAGGSVVFGETLREVIITVLKSAGGNVLSAEAQLPALQDLLKLVINVTVQQSGRVGAREARWLISHLVTSVVNDGTVAVMRGGQPTRIAIAAVSADEVLALLQEVSA